MFILKVFFFYLLSLSLIKEIFFLNLASIKTKRALELLLSFYFLFIIFYAKQSDFSILFLLLPCVFILFLFFFLKKQEEKNLLFQLASLILPLESKMKSGLSFFNAWQQSLLDVKSKKIKDKLRSFTQVFQYQKEFHYPEDKQVELFIKDLILIYQSPQPLKRLQHLRRKVKIELAFRIKSQRALMQVRIQSGILCFFYIGLLAWTAGHGSKYTSLILSSLLLFIIGLIWILKTGRQMKWSV